MELLNITQSDSTILFNELLHNKDYNAIIDTLSDKSKRLSLGENKVYRLLSLITNSEQPLVKYSLASKKKYLESCSRKEFRFIITSLIEEPSNLNCMCLIKIRQLFSKEDFENKIKNICLEDHHFNFLNGVLLSNNL